MYTLGTYVYRKFHPKAQDLVMDIKNLAVTKGLVAQSKDRTPQLIQVTAATNDIATGTVDFTWRNVDKQGAVQESFASAKCIFGQASTWLDSWAPMSHLIQSRVGMLEQMAAEGTANRFSHNMAYKMFASNLVDYADKYRGMQTVVQHELEGFADIRLTTKESGVWTVPPYFIDSVAHLAGFIMNCSDVMDSENNFCVTPGWKSMRFAKPLIAGAKYRSYVKMIPSADDPSAFFGDVYIMQDGVIVGMVAGMEFHRYPRILLGRFFSPPDGKAVAAAPAAEAKPKPAAAVQAQPSKPVPATQEAPPPREAPLPTNHPGHQPGPPKSAPAEVPAKTAPPAAAGGADSTTAKALQLIANEAALEAADLQNEIGFVDVGIDSLMSLVIAEKLRAQLGVTVSGSLFLDYPTVGDLKEWLDESYG